MAMKASRLRLRAPIDTPASNEHDVQEWGEIFREQLLERWCTGRRFTGADLCTLAHSHTMSGGCGVDDLKVSPSQKGDNQARKLRTAFGLGDVKLKCYELLVPIWDGDLEVRSETWIPVRLPHEVIARDYEHRPEAYSKNHVDRDDYMTNSFLEHPVTVEFGHEAVWPIGFYTDKVRLGQSDSFYRGSVGATFVRKKLTCWMMRESMLCRCGCNGLCSIDTIQIAMNQSLNLLQKKLFMAFRFDRLDWRPNDIEREARAGAELPIRGAVCEYRADLPERCARAGIKSHNAAKSCMVCYCDGNDMYNRFHECGLQGSCWPSRDHNSYLDELLFQLVMVKIPNRLQHSRLLRSLELLTAHPWGRCVQGRMGATWGLRAGDRLILGGDLITDIHGLEKLHPPYTVFFSDLIRILA